MAQRLKVTNFGQIKSADIVLGDLTVLVGPQATGKSILLQLLKLMVDRGQVQRELEKHGLDWRGELENFLDVYFGEGMSGLWSAKSALSWEGRPINLPGWVKRKGRESAPESMFLIPAQRVLTLAKGWPRPFTDYSPGDPFMVRDFSEKLRVLMETGFDKGGKENLFPRERWLKAEYRTLLSASVFSAFELGVDRLGSQKRLVLTSGARGKPLPFMVWSAGQREFVPLLLGLYWLLPPRAVGTRDQIRWVVIEELEMGLHPQAISATLLLVLELLARGYRVCLSTHSPHVLDLVWALGMIKRHGGGAEEVLDLFAVDHSQQMRKVAERVLDKTSRVYLFEKKSGSTKDITNLDPASDDVAEAEWGGLSEFSGRAAEVVARVVRNGAAKR